MAVKIKIISLEKRLEKQKKCRFIFIRTEEEADRFYKYVEEHETVPFKGVFSKKMEAHCRGIDVHKLDGTCFDKYDF